MAMTPEQEQSVPSTKVERDEAAVRVMVNEILYPSASAIEQELIREKMFPALRRDEQPRIYWDGSM